MQTLQKLQSAIDSYDRNTLSIEKFVEIANLMGVIQGIESTLSDDDYLYLVNVIAKFKNFVNELVLKINPLEKKPRLFNDQANANIQFIDKYLKNFKKNEKLIDMQESTLDIMFLTLASLYDKYHHTKKLSELSLGDDTLDTMRENLKTINTFLGKSPEERFSTFPKTLEQDENNSKKNTKSDTKEKIITLKNTGFEAIKTNNKGKADSTESGTTKKIITGLAVVAIAIAAIFLALDVIHIIASISMLVVPGLVLTAVIAKQCYDKSKDSGKTPANP